MRIFVIKEFSKWAKASDITDDLLRKAVDEIERGLIDADLGSHLLKKRIATKGEARAAVYVLYSLFPKAIEPYLCTDSRKVNEIISPKRKESYYKS